MAYFLPVSSITLQQAFFRLSPWHFLLFNWMNEDVVIMNQLICSDIMDDVKDWMILKNDNNNANIPDR
ncbi:Uncharacterised protein [uncultured archaeon]|nr:Uncharacterised protein [uncultured archaeon]